MQSFQHHPASDFVDGRAELKAASVSGRLLARRIDDASQFHRRGSYQKMAIIPAGNYSTAPSASIMLSGNTRTSWARNVYRLSKQGSTSATESLLMRR
jgi:hypothetical protein